MANQLRPQDEPFWEWRRKRDQAVLDEIGFLPCDHFPPHRLAGYNNTVFGELRKRRKVVIQVTSGSSYWVVKGAVPLHIAIELEKADAEKIRAGGYAGGGSPLLWAKKDAGGNYFVHTYHIDSDIALQKFVSVLRQQKLVD